MTVSMNTSSFRLVSVLEHIESTQHILRSTVEKEKGSFSDREQQLLNMYVGPFSYLITFKL